MKKYPLSRHFSLSSSQWAALKISFIYLIIGTLWILFSDYALFLFTREPEVLLALEIIKGWVYIIVTAALLYVLIRRNISSIERSERARSESELSYKELSDSITDVFLAVDKDLTVTYWNKAVQQITGLSPEAALGRNVFDAFLLPREAETIALFQSILDKKQPAHFIREYWRENRQYFFDVNIYPSLSGLSIFSRDITRQKQDEIRLEATLAQTRSLQENIVNVITSITEKRDPYIAGHQHRAARLAVEIGRALDFNKDRLEGLRVASMLHDIGRIFIPAEILSKPGKLSEYEMNIIRIYPTVSYDILKEIPFPWPIADIALQHQEKINGSGYPKGLRNGQILLEARIIAVADFIDAATSHRPHRPAMSMKEALRELEKNKGSLYDTAVVETCEQVLLREGSTAAEAH